MASAAAWREPRPPGARLRRLRLLGGLLLQPGRQRLLAGVHGHVGAIQQRLPLGLHRLGRVVVRLLLGGAGLVGVLAGGADQVQQLGDRFGLAV
jgi:hypothetical protein